MGTELVDGPLKDHLVEANVSGNDAVVLQQTFEPYFAQAQEWRAKAKAIQVTSVDDKEGMKAARSARLALKEIRVNVEKTRKQLKEESLRKGKAIDGMANVIKYLISPIEAHLQEQEDFAKREAERIRRELQDKREQEIRFLDGNPTLYNLGDMTEEDYQQVLKMAKHNREAKLEEAKRVEQERIAREKAEAEERERIRKENERLKVEAAKREAEIAAEREKARKEAEAREKALAAEREKARLEQERIRKEAEAKERAEREAREKAEWELREKREAEERARAEEAERQRQASLAPDKQKLTAFADKITAIEIPDVSSEEAKEVLEHAIGLLSKASQWIKTQSVNL